MGPETAHSPNAEDMNALYWVMFVLIAVILVAINAALIALAVRFRGGRGRRPRRLRSRGRPQLAVATALTILAAAVFTAGVIFTERASDVEEPGPGGLQAAALTTAQVGIDVPAANADAEGAEDGDSVEPLTIKASGQQWLWRYEYPDGTFSYYELVVPAQTSVVVEVSSTDVIHRWWVPGLSAKSDAVPDRVNRTWFKVDQPGSFEGASYAFSGAAYATMRTRVRVVEVSEYEAWLEQQSEDITEAQELVQERIAPADDAEEDQP